ncbi:MAG: FG-GAP-like repeat-containing protein, partial [Pirellulales bacterium]
VLQDLDHDGWIDIYVGVDAIPTGNRFATHKGGNPAWSRNGEKWTEVRKEWGVGFEANCVCVPAADFDNDGDLDLLLVNFYKNVVLYRNNTNDENWIKVKPVGAKTNPDGIGAQVRLYRGSGGEKFWSAREPFNRGPATDGRRPWKPTSAWVASRPKHTASRYSSRPQKSRSRKKPSSRANASS